MFLAMWSYFTSLCKIRILDAGVLIISPEVATLEIQQLPNFTPLSQASNFTSHSTQFLQVLRCGPVRTCPQSRIPQVRQSAHFSLSLMLVTSQNPEALDAEGGRIPAEHLYNATATMYPHMTGNNTLSTNTHLDIRLRGQSQSQRHIA